MYSQPQVPEDQNLGWEGGYREATLDKEAAKRIAGLPEAAATVPVAAVTKRRRERRWVKKVELHTTSGRLLNLDAPARTAPHKAPDCAASYSRCGMGVEGHRSSKGAEHVRRIQKQQEEERTNLSSLRKEVLQKARELSQSISPTGAATANSGGRTRARFSRKNDSHSQINMLIAHPTMNLGFKMATGGKPASRRVEHCSIPGLTQMALGRSEGTTALNEHGLYNTGIQADAFRTIARWPAGKNQVVVRKGASRSYSSMH